jgi:hypothetical protein
VTVTQKGAASASNLAAAVSRQPDALAEVPTVIAQGPALGGKAIDAPVPFLNDS